ncbi:MAG: gamma carbonic anhydrase family protein [Sandaracinaceae bacterium]|jgi:carbonic anhydrase/acetyltransferase-like protein (isoleucine patch superfamily)|nr:gamma carbonic anhydrase family protein [Sandaracinaceae bacterium]
MTNLYPYKGLMPRVDSTCFIAPNASVIGQVTLGAETSIWFGTVLRGDVAPIRIGARTSIQDNSVIHATGGISACSVGDDCTIGHGVTLHGCTVGNGSLIGMGSIVLDNAEIGANSMVGAGSLVTVGTKIPSGVLAHGRPAKVVRPLTEDEQTMIKGAAVLYVGYGRDYLAG